MSYTLKCRELYFKRINPSNPLSIHKIAYTELIDIANQEIKKVGIELFSCYFQEMQYRVDLWTAHILYEREDVSSEIKNDCLSIIKNYSITRLNIDLAKEEENWLRKI